MGPELLPAVPMSPKVRPPACSERRTLRELWLSGPPCPLSPAVPGRGRLIESDITAMCFIGAGRESWLSLLFQKHTGYTAGTGCASSSSMHGRCLVPTGLPLLPTTPSSPLGLPDVCIQ